MKQPTEEQIKEGMNKAYKEAGHNAYFGNGFYAGIEFIIKQINDSKSDIDHQILFAFGYKVMEAIQDNPSWSLEELADDFLKNNK